MNPPFDVEQQLERHGQALRSLAGELVRDAATADDAVQEVWVHALDRGPRHSRSFGGWLRTVQLHVASKLRRSDRRRARHEAIGGGLRGVAGEDHATVLAREELAQRLLAAVRSLDAPYRDAIWQRFFEGKAPREIAATNGIAVATVKSRLQRGLGILRERLAEGGRDGSDWRSALACAFALREGAAVASAAAVMTGGVLVTTWTKGVLMAATALVVAVVGMWLARDDVMNPRAVASAEAPSAIAEHASWPKESLRREVAGDASTLPNEARRTPGAEEVRESTVRGRCVDANGAPLAECAATLSGALTSRPGNQEWLLEHGNERPEWQAQTGTDGRFEFQFVPPPPFLFSLAVEGVGWARAGKWWQSIEAGAVIDIGDVVMEPGALLRGRIVDAQGLPVANVQIDHERPDVDPLKVRSLPLSNYAAARSRDDGSFAFTVPLPLGSYRLRLSDHYTVRSPTEVVLRAGRPVEEIQVIAEVADVPTVRGVVIDDVDQPVAYARVTCRRADEPPVDGANTDHLGRFTVRCLSGDASKPVLLRAEAEGGESDAEQVRVEWGARDVRLRVTRGPQLTVFVGDDAGSPVEGCSLRVEPTDTTRWRNGSPSFQARTKADGLARIHSLGRGSYFVIAQFAPSRGLQPCIERVALAGRSCRLDLRVGTAAARRVRVVHADGTAVANARVQLCELLGNAFDGRCVILEPMQWFDGGGAPKILALDHGVTAVDGCVTLRGPAGRDFGLRVLAPGLMTFERSGVRVDVAEDFVAVMTAGARLKGSIVPPEAVSELRRLSGKQAGEPFAGLQRPIVRLHNQARSLPSRMASIDAPECERFWIREDGTFDVPGLPLGPWRAEVQYWVRSESMAMTRTVNLGPFVLEEGRVAEVRVDLTHLLPGTIQALVVESGEPIAKTTFVVESDLGLNADGKEDKTFAMVKTDASGRFEFRGPPGRHWLRRSHDVTRIAAPTIDLARGAVVPVTFEFTVGTVELRLLLPDGRPASGVEVSIEGLARTQTDGSLRVRTSVGTFPVRVLPRRLQSSENKAALAIHTKSGDALAAPWLELGTATVIAGQTTTLELRLPQEWEK